jgi:hypothetical protein
VTVAGTSLETSTINIDANLDGTIKFHMQPWLPSKFDAMLSKMKRTDEETLNAVVIRHYGILEKVITNARCAYILSGLQMARAVQ